MILNKDPLHHIHVSPEQFQEWGLHHFSGKPALEAIREHLPEGSSMTLRVLKVQSFNLWKFCLGGENLGECAIDHESYITCRNLENEQELLAYAQSGCRK